MTPHELRRWCETDLAPFLVALAADPRDGAAFAGLVSAVAGQIIPGARFAQEGAISAIAVHSSGLFGPRAEKCESRGRLVGATRPAGLELAEVRLYQVREHHDPTRPHANRRLNVRRETDLFRGLFFAFDLGGTARGTTFLDPHSPGPAAADRGALDPVRLDDPAFERTFQVTSSDPAEARALLMPSSRAGLVALAQAAGAPVFVSLSDGRVSVAVEYHDFVLQPDGRPVERERVAAMVRLFSLVERAAAALPVGVELAVNDRRPDAEAPARPATSRTRVTSASGRLEIRYTGAVQPVVLALTGLAAPFLLWFWSLAVRALLAPRLSDGALAAMIPLAVSTLVWLFGAQAWWVPVRRLDVVRGEVEVSRGLLRRTRVRVPSADAIEADGALHLGRVPLTPRLPGAELRWLAYEIRAALDA